MDNSAQNPVSQTLEETLDGIERDLLNAISESLRANKMSVEQAQKLARDFISQLPPQDQKDLLEKLKKISQMHPEARDIYLKYAREDFENDRDAKLHLITQHIQNGDVDSALNVAKGGAQNG